MINRDIAFYLARGEGVLDIDEYHTVTHVLGLSYDSLPPRLKHCFLCLANYKEDEEIKLEELYLLWIGERLISVEDKAEGEMMLNVVERYLDELAHRSLVQVEPWEYEGESWSKFRVCRVHDLIRDPCLSKVKEEGVIKVIALQQKPYEEINYRIRRLCIRSFGDQYEETIDQNVVQQIRSLLLFKDYNWENVGPGEIFTVKEFKLLRLLTVKGFIIREENLKGIAKLVYLKFLSFKDSQLVELLSSIGNLRNLETLDLRVWSPLRIPNVLWKLKKLKQLYLPAHTYGESIDDHDKLRFDGLNELEILENFDSAYCETSDLIGLSKIKVFCGEMIAETEITTEFLKSKQVHYSSLKIKGPEVLSCLVLLLECSFLDSLYISTCINVLPKQYDNIRLSGKLTTLSLYGCKFEEDPMKLLEKLPNLSFLSLEVDSYLGTEMTCSATGFSQLQYLFLYSLPNLRNWRVDEGAMPNLSTLHIYTCNKMEMLPDGLKFLAVLKHLYIYRMPKAFKDRLRAIDGIEGHDFYKVRHISNIVCGSSDIG